MQQLQHQQEKKQQLLQNAKQQVRYSEQKNPEKTQHPRNRYSKEGWSETMRKNRGIENRTMEREHEKGCLASPLFPPPFHFPCCSPPAISHSSLSCLLHSFPRSPVSVWERESKNLFSSSHICVVHVLHRRGVRKFSAHLKKKLTKRRR